MVKEIPLTRGYIVLVDDDNYQELSQYNWCAFGRYPHIYAMHRCTIGGKSVAITMHRMIMGDPTGMDVHHLNHNTLDNQKNNLQICTRCNHSRNSFKWRKKTSSQYKGVHFFKRYKLWQAYITVNDKRIFLGYYKTEQDAAIMYNRYALKYFGSFANLNNVEDAGQKIEQAYHPLDTYSKFKGVTFDTRRNKWWVQVWMGTKSKYIGSYDTETDAALAYDEFVITHHLDKPLNLVKVQA